MVSLHPVQTALAATDTTPGAARRALLNAAPNDEDLATIRAYLQQQRAYGRDDLRAMVEAKTHHFASVRTAHRPAKARVIPAQANLSWPRFIRKQMRRIGRR